jgi:hypothetical protein
VISFGVDARAQASLRDGVQGVLAFRCSLFDPPSRLSASFGFCARQGGTLGVSFLMLLPYADFPVHSSSCGNARLILSICFDAPDSG